MSGGFVGAIADNQIYGFRFHALHKAKAILIEDGYFLLIESTGLSIHLIFALGYLISKFLRCHCSGKFAVVPLYHHPTIAHLFR